MQRHANVVELRKRASWKVDFRAHVMKTNFCLTMSQTMIEMLCAVADQVRWDRSLYDGGSAYPDTWYVSENALIKRGLIVRAPSSRPLAEKYIRDHWKLTPAGEALVELFKVTGIFVEADAAIHVRAQGRKKK